MKRISKIIFRYLSLLFIPVVASCGNDDALGGDGGFSDKKLLGVYVSFPDETRSAPDEDNYVMSSLSFNVTSLNNEGFSQIYKGNLMENQRQFELDSLAKGFYKIYALGNSNFDTRVSSATPENLTFDINPDRLNEISAIPMSGTASVELNESRWVPVEMKLAGAKVILNLIFNPDWLTDDLKGKGLRITKVEVENVAAKGFVFQGNEDLSLERLTAPIEVTGLYYDDYIYDEGGQSDLAIGLGEPSVSPAEEDGNWMYQTVFYLPEMIIKEGENPVNVNIEAEITAESGETLKTTSFEIMVQGDGETGNYSISRGSLYEIVGRIKTGGVTAGPAYKNNIGIVSFTRIGSISRISNGP
ncbi:MAG: hypothetical protein J1F43_01690 [Muribaculaceae bacterium]|nr:hypothetical protein [Muribaculaceae bacterium]